jgi:hypothetical protein
VKRNLLLFFLISAGVVILFAVALYIPTSLPAHSDFSALYNTDLALVNRVPIYDLPRVEALAQERSGIPAENFFLARFPYPPWYALSTFYLGLLSPNAAATLWFEINLVMLFLSVWLLTDGWPGRLRLIAFPLALFFFPVLGALAVGQYDFPVLLGASLLFYSLRRKNVALAVLGMVLLIFKPHVGALVLLSAFLWLIIYGGGFGRRVIRFTAVAAILLFLTGFLADPLWLLRYPRMLFDYQSEGNVSGCTECASLPVSLSRALLDGSLANAVWIAIVLLFIFAIILYRVRSAWTSHETLLSAAVLVTLLVSPYLYNYDFLLLLVPFAVLFHRGGLLQKVIVVLCYLVPTFALLLLGRAGNTSLLLVTLVLTGLLAMSMFRDKKPVIDSPAS